MMNRAPVATSGFDSEDSETDVDPLPPAVNPDAGGSASEQGQTIITFVSNESTDDV